MAIKFEISKTKNPFWLDKEFFNIDFADYGVGGFNASNDETQL